MSYSFAPRQGLIVVETEVEGPSGNVVLRLALDTGATDTLINRTMLLLAGYDPAQASAFRRITTAGGATTVPQLALTRISALGHDCAGFLVLCHSLPPGTGVDGLLGLDFLRGKTLTVDFRSGSLTLI